MSNLQFFYFLFLFLLFFSFQASGDHLPVAPPAPAHSQLAAQQAANYQPKNYDLGDAANFDDGQYDPRYNDPNFEGNLRSGVPQASYVQQPIPQQPQYVPQQPQPQPQAYNNLNNINYVAQYQTTTPNPHRFQPPGTYTMLLIWNYLITILHISCMMDHSINIFFSFQTIR